jgi:oligopeptide transport system ATP-binding protein
MSLLEAKHLTKRFATKRNLLGQVTEWFTAVDDVSFNVEEGETLALVGESGAGKSTTGRMVLRLIEPDEGELHFDGEDLLGLDGPAMRKRRQRLQMIFQDPFSSLPPHRPIGEAVAEPLLVHHRMSSKERLRIAATLLDRVGLSAGVQERYPSELSGGQLQRAAIARALTLEPKLIVCDEPVAALDVSVRAQVLNLMHELQRELQLTYLFVSHDLALVEVIADRVAVMSQGRIVEEGPAAQLFRSPQTEYTAELLRAVPRPIPRSLRTETTTVT